MLCPRVLMASLKKMSTGGVQSVMLFNPEGVLLAFTSPTGELEQPTAAIAANMWNIYQRHLESSEEDGVQEIMLELTEGRLIICKLSSFILCLQGTKEVPLGMLRAKANALCANLEEQLNELTVI